MTKQKKSSAKEKKNRHSNARANKSLGGLTVKELGEQLFAHERFFDRYLHAVTPLSWLESLSAQASTQAKSEHEKITLEIVPCGKDNLLVEYPQNLNDIKVDRISMCEKMKSLKHMLSQVEGKLSEINIHCNMLEQADNKIILDFITDFDKNMNTAILRRLEKSEDDLNTIKNKIKEILINSKGFYIHLEEVLKREKNKLRIALSKDYTINIVMGIEVDHIERGSSFYESLFYIDIYLKYFDTVSRDNLRSLTHMFYQFGGESTESIDFTGSILNEKDNIENLNHLICNMLQEIGASNLRSYYIDMASEKPASMKDVPHFDLSLLENFELDMNDKTLLTKVYHNLQQLSLGIKYSESVIENGLRYLTTHGDIKNKSHRDKLSKLLYELYHKQTCTQLMHFHAQNMSVSFAGTMALQKQISDVLSDCHKPLAELNDKISAAQAKRIPTWVSEHVDGLGLLQKGFGKNERHILLFAEGLFLVNKALMRYKQEYTVALEEIATGNVTEVAELGVRLQQIGVSYTKALNFLLEHMELLESIQNNQAILQSIIQKVPDHSTKEVLEFAVVTNKKPTSKADNHNPKKSGKSREVSSTKEVIVVEKSMTEKSQDLYRIMEEFLPQDKILKKTLHDIPGIDIDKPLSTDKEAILVEENSTKKRQDVDIIQEEFLPQNKLVEKPLHDVPDVEVGKETILEAVVQSTADKAVDFADSAKFKLERIEESFSPQNNDLEKPSLDVPKHFFGEQLPVLSTLEEDYDYTYYEEQEKIKTKEKNIQKKIEREEQKKIQGQDLKKHQTFDGKMSPEYFRKYLDKDDCETLCVLFGQKGKTLVMSHIEALLGACGFRFKKTSTGSGRCMKFGKNTVGFHGDHGNQLNEPIKEYQKFYFRSVMQAIGCEPSLLFPETLDKTKLSHTH